MRHLILIFFAAVVAVGCEPQGPGYGTEGHHCRTGLTFALCDEGLECVNHYCSGCGGDGESCCYDSHDCDVGACDRSAAESADWYCQSDCGSVGLPCCDDGGCDGTCNNGSCEEAAGGACVEGHLEYVVHIVDYECGTHDELLYADVSADAEACRQAIIDGGSNGNLEVSELDGAPPALTDVCSDGYGGYHLWHYSDAQLAACEQYYCPTCQWTNADANGHCPLDP